MHLCVLMCSIHTVNLLRVSATYVAIFREVHYKEYKQRNITKVFGDSAQI
jgi:hypothetical protein